MGRIYHAQCAACGYTKELFLGVGLRSPEKKVIGLCESCKELYEISLKNETEDTPATCPECSQPIRTINQEEKQKMSCPKCGQAHIQLIPCGLWD